MHRTFNEFKSTRTRTTLQALIDTGCDAAKSYADCSDETLDQAEVFAYKTNSDDFTVFIDIIEAMRTMRTMRLALSTTTLSLRLWNSKLSTRRASVDSKKNSIVGSFVKVILNLNRRMLTC